VFNFAVEVVVVYLYAVMRQDLRCWIPDGAHGPGSYAVAAAGQNRDLEVGGQDDSIIGENSVLEDEPKSPQTPTSPNREKRSVELPGGVPQPATVV
jgi:hypothetical protein